MKTVLCVSATALILLAILVPAAFTNWFRYPLSLESTFVLAPVIAIVVIGAILHVVAFRWKRRGVASFAAVASVVLAALITVVRTREAFGTWLPGLAVAHVDRNGDQTTLGPHGAAVIYHLELHNPFATSAKTYLVGTDSGRPFKIALPIGRIPMYGEAMQASDWVTLSPTTRPGVFIASVTVDPMRTHVFEVDVPRGTAKPLRR